MISRLDAWGGLSLYVYDRDGRKIDEIHVQNLIVNLGKIHLLSLIAGKGGALAIKKMALGEGGCAIPPAIPTVAQLFAPIPFEVSNTSLRHPLEIVRQVEDNPPIDSGTKIVTFTAFFNSADVPTTAYISGIPNVTNEAALLSGDDVVVALRSFRSIPFDQASAIGIRAVWAIGIG